MELKKRRNMEQKMQLKAINCIDKKEKENCVRDGRMGIYWTKSLNLRSNIADKTKDYYKLYAS